MDYDDFNLMGVLHVLLETQSVTRTSERLGVSQPTISRALARLRERFGDALLVRSGTGMVLTPRAEQLREPLARWLAEGRSLLQPETVRPGEIERSFRIASTDFGVLSVIAPTIGEITRAAPRGSLEVEPLTAGSVRRLARGELDVIVTGFDPDQAVVHSRFLFTERFLMLARSDHPLLGGGNSPGLEAVLQWPQLRVSIPEADIDRFGAALVERGLARRSVVQIDDFSAAPYLVARSDAVAVLPATAARQFADLHRLACFEPPIDLGEFRYWLAWHERSRRDAATRWLIDRLSAPFDAAARAAE